MEQDFLKTGLYVVGPGPSVILSGHQGVQLRKEACFSLATKLRGGMYLC